MKKPIRAMIVDDSAVVRQVISALLSQEPDIEVLATASDPLFAYEKMKHAWPDVLVIDVEMPRMDGITFLRKIMSERPTPVVVCSTLTEQGTETTMQALAAGAVCIITKPRLGLKTFLEDSAADLVGAVRAAAQANMRCMVPLATPSVTNSKPPVLASAATAMVQTTERVIALGTSTGGTLALETILTALPRSCPGIVIVQHMPEKFTALFAARLNQICEIEVAEARNGDRVLPGRALIAPGGRHLQIRRSGAQYFAEVSDGPLVNRHRPSVDVLFRSTAKCAGKNSMGIIMTGMGADGARGLKEMHDVGATTYAQDEASCVVFGMPKEAIKLGAVKETVALQNIASLIAAYG